MVGRLTLDQVVKVRVLAPQLFERRAFASVGAGAADARADLDTHQSVGAAAVSVRGRVEEEPVGATVKTARQLDPHPARAGTQRPETASVENAPAGVQKAVANDRGGRQLDAEAQD